MYFFQYNSGCSMPPVRLKHPRQRANGVRRSVGVSVGIVAAIAAHLAIVAGATLLGFDLEIEPLDGDDPNQISFSDRRGAIDTPSRVRRRS